MTLKILEAGDNIIPDGLMLEKTGNRVTVRPKMGVVAGNRCVDCKHFSSGKATLIGYTTTVCLLQPKNITANALLKGEKLYYHTGSRIRACDKFEAKEENAK